MDLIADYLVPFLVQLTVIISSIIVIKKNGKMWVDKLLLNPIQATIKCMDMDYCKGYLVDFINDIKHGDKKTELQLKYAHEKYDHYTQVLGGNSYIHDEWQDLKTLGKI